MINKKLSYLVMISMAYALFPLNVQAASGSSSPVAFDGVVMLDAARFDGVYGKGDEQKETQVRRAILGLTAELSDDIEGELSIKLEDGLDEAEVKEALLSWEFIKGQKLIIGQQKEPVGLENNQSSKQIPAIERSMASSLFTPDRHMGLLYSARDSRVLGEIGLFEADDESEDSGLAISGRMAFAAFKNDVQTLHIGGSGSFRDINGTSIKFKDEGEVDPAANIISGKRRDVELIKTVALEAAWLRGALSVQSEWFRRDMELAEHENASDPSYSGAYIQTAWIFGQAHRRYRNGAFKIAGLKGGSAWEMVFRMGWADLRDDKDGIKAETLLAGLNYYKDKHLRIMTSLQSADTSGPDVSDYPSGNAANARLQYIF